MSNKIMELYNKLRGKTPKPPAEMSIHNRNVGDISISIEEGLSNTRKITVSGWNPAITSALFWEVRGGLRDPGKAEAYEAVALMKAKQFLTEAFKASQDEEVS